MQNVDEVQELRELMEKFVEDRFKNDLDKKLKKNISEEEIDKLKEKYQLENWLDDAARRASQIQLATHAVKYLNSTIKYLDSNPRGMNFYVKTHDKALSFISTYSLSDKKEDAVVGTAAVLDVYKFLQLEYNDKNLLARILNNDTSFLAALPGTADKKIQWCHAFAEITNSKNKPASHELAKQIYFPISENNYHIIAPLFPTSLVHAVYEKIQTRYDEKTKMARAAKKAEKPYLQGYSEYINLAVQRFGGANKQNVSQLNSVRGGKCYLLPSLPPNWQSTLTKMPLGIASIFPKFNFQVRDKVRTLKNFLTQTAYNNINIRDTRAALVMQICDALLTFADKFQQLPAGWSANPECKLNETQKFWLDPGRTELDAVWAEQRQIADWQTEVSDDFARWLNAKLTTRKLRFGDAEHHEWKKLIEHELAMFKEGLQ